jgi:acyl carrier protein
MIDEEYDVVIEGNDFKKISTVGELITEIESRK